MNTLELWLPFISGIVLSFLFRNSIFIHIEKETKDRKKMMDGIALALASNEQETVKRLTLLETNSEEMKDVIGRLHSDYVSVRDLTRSIEGFVTYPILKANLEGLEANLEGTKERLERLDANTVTMKDLERSTEGYMTYPSIKELLADVKETILTESQAKAAAMVIQSEAVQSRRVEAALRDFEHAVEGVVTYASLQNMLQEFKESLVTRSEVKDFVTAEKAANMVFQSEAIQRRRVKAALQAKMSEEVTAAAASDKHTANPKESEYYQGWMASAEANGIKVEVEICNTQTHTKSENKEWLDEDGSIGAIHNREIWMEAYHSDTSAWKQSAVNPNEYSMCLYKAGEWSTGVKTEMKLLLPAPPPRMGDLPPPPPRDGSICRDVARKMIPLLVWEKVLLAVESM